MQRDVVDWAAEHPDAYGIEPQARGSTEFALVIRVARQPPSEWALVIGDLLTDLRCSLDYAVYELAVANNDGVEPDNPRSVEFPVAHGGDWFKRKGVRKLAGLPDAAISDIERFQPFQRQPVEHDPLFQLNELVGIYKHRFIKVAWTTIAGAEVPISITGGTLRSIVTCHDGGELKDGEILATLTVDAETHGEIKFKPRLTTDVAIAPPNTIDGPAFGLYANAKTVGGRVEQVLNELERHL